MTITLNVNSREEKKPNALRQEGFIPAELYGKEEKNQHLAVDSSEFKKVYQEAGESSLIDLKFEDGKTIPVLIGEVAKSPVSEEILHIDLRQVSMTEKIEAEVELVFVGEAPAVVALGGTFMSPKNTITVKALPTALVSSIEVDISSLAEFNDKIIVSDVKLPDGVEAVDEPNTLVASVAEPKVEEEAPVESEADAVSDVEVAGEKKEDSEGGAKEDKKEDGKAEEAKSE